ncbi:hypothetical protein AVEN_160098-1 [Araneus ventricosus]|uniref:Transposon Ty3-I Gag-Pol polyprotein n=1 Tax=Araneus ventricosus TaxID=182803 RepID=A0A4Y2GFK0_ARAVE|nr:hypothetical protein AVEN_160098-1 [Araneus ventricosus]
MTRMQFEPREISIPPYPRRGAENRAYPTLNQKRYPEQNPKLLENPKPEKNTLREKCSSSSITLYTCHASASPTSMLDIRIGDIHERSGVVLDLKNKRWYITDKSHHKICFKEDLAENSLLTAESIIANSCHLREDEGTPLKPEQREKMSYLLEILESICKPGGDPTPYAEHHIYTEKHLPVSLPPYRISPMKKEQLRKDIEDLLEKDAIEEFESAYGAPVVKIPKPDGKTRLCINYRKLNEITLPDSYPLPRMDDLF